MLCSIGRRPPEARVTSYPGPHPRVIPHGGLTPGISPLPRGRDDIIAVCERQGLELTANQPGVNLRLAQHATPSTTARRRSTVVALVARPVSHHEAAAFRASRRIRLVHEQRWRSTDSRHRK